MGSPSSLKHRLNPVRLQQEEGLVRAEGTVRGANPRPDPGSLLLPENLDSTAEKRHQVWVSAWTGQAGGPAHW